MIVVEDSRIEDNSARLVGGALALFSGGGLRVNASRSSFARNLAYLDGGALYATRANLTVANVTFADNTAVTAEGGAFRVDGGAVRGAMTCRRNFAGSNGGCGAVSDVVFDVYDTVAFNNSCWGYGGAFKVGGAASGALRDSALDRNDGAIGGAVAFVGAASATVDRVAVDASTGDCLATWKGHSKYVSSVAVFPSGDRVVSGPADNTLKLWGAASQT